MKGFSSFVLLSLLLLQTVCGAEYDFKTAQSRAAEAIEKIGQTKDKVFLYSLDPNDPRIYQGKLPENSDKLLHRYPILGQVEVTSPQEKASLFGALSKGVRESTGTLANCFDPRHGIRVISSKATNGFVICFACLQVQAYGFEGGQYFLTSSSPGTVFNGFLSKYNIKQVQ
jgi:hypothetical protein